MDLVPLLGGKNFHQSGLRFSPAGGGRGVETRKRSRVGLGGTTNWREEGVPTKGKEEENLKAKMVQVHK